MHCSRIFFEAGCDQAGACFKSSALDSQLDNIMLSGTAMCMALFKVHHGTIDSLFSSAHLRLCSLLPLSVLHHSLEICLHPAREPLSVE